MATRDKQYRRFPRLSRRPHASHTLWLGDDHVLLVNSTFVTERYSRISYDEIRAVTIRRTTGAIWCGGVFGVLIVLFGLIAASVGSPAWSLILLVAALVLFLWNLVLGHSCACRVYTSIGAHPVRALFRLKYARQFVRAISQRIYEVQSPLGERQLIERIQGMMAAESAVVAAPPQSMQSNHGQSNQPA
ncbi:MAG: hypothetical protein ACYS8X_00385 [Planctomycetota bacterium]